MKKDVNIKSVWKVFSFVFWQNIDYFLNYEIIFALEAAKLVTIIICIVYLSTLMWFTRSCVHKTGRATPPSILTVSVVSIKWWMGEGGGVSGMGGAWYDFHQCSCCGAIICSISRKFFNLNFSRRGRLVFLPLMFFLSSNFMFD